MSSKLIKLIYLNSFLFKGFLFKHTTTTFLKKGKFFEGKNILPMANFEETYESKLDTILGELSSFENKTNNSFEKNGHSSNSLNSDKINLSMSLSENGVISDAIRESYMESPDNDSAFSDTVSLLSSESSASSSVIMGIHVKRHQDSKSYATAELSEEANNTKIFKNYTKLQTLDHKSIRRLFVKAFSSDGASKSLLVDDEMTCGDIVKLLADKNHVQMGPQWALVEQLTDFQMERFFEDHEILVHNLMKWSSESKNRILFLECFDKIALFNSSEKFLCGTQMTNANEKDKQTRSMVFDKFFHANSEVTMDGPLYVKNEFKKCWKRVHFVMKSSGLYYFPKEKTKLTRDLNCLALFKENEIYKGIGWKKKYKAPTDHTFAFKPLNDSFCMKTCRGLKMLCAEDSETLENWLTAIRITRYGKLLLDNYKYLTDDLNEKLKKCSSINSNGNMASPRLQYVKTIAPELGSNGRLSRASSSSSSGCLSDENNGFDSEFTTGTIKRKPSMKPNLPLTSMTRQLKEVGEMRETTMNEIGDNASVESNDSLIKKNIRRRNEEGNKSGTLKTQQELNLGSKENVHFLKSSMSSLTSNCLSETRLSNLSDTRSSFNNMEEIPTTDENLSYSLTSSDKMNVKLVGSTSSLNSLPPPPSPNELANHLTGSELSLVSLPPPPFEVKPIFISTAIQKPISDTIVCSENVLYNQPFSSVRIAEKNSAFSFNFETAKPSMPKAPPYVFPPSYSVVSTDYISNSSKNVSFTNSPVLLNRKTYFEDQNELYYQRMLKIQQEYDTLDRFHANEIRLSSMMVLPKKLTESSNPPCDFLKDLQRVIRKKWQVAQKCKQEPTITPHEVLGFRDFKEFEFGSSSNYYRKPSNVSNWVQEHYGSVQNTANEIYVYENTNNNNEKKIINTYTEKAFQSTSSFAQKKRLPPPLPKRSESTHLTHRL